MPTTMGCGRGRYRCCVGSSGSGSSNNTADPRWLRGLPQIALVLSAGVVADRLSRQQVMLAADVVRFAAQTWLAVAQSPPDNKIENHEGSRDVQIAGLGLT